MTTPRVTVPVEPTEAMRLVPDRVLTETLYWMARAYERVHSMSRVSDTELANKIEAAKADLGRARDASPILSNSAAPAPEGGAVKRACVDFQEAIDDFEADVADVMAEGSERADLWDREIMVNIDALKTVMNAALATREEAPAEAGALEWSRFKQMCEEKLSDAIKADHGDAPFPTDESEAASYHRTRADLLGWVLDMWPTEPPALRAQPQTRAWGWDYEICTGCSASLTMADIKAGGQASCCPERRMVTVRDLVDAYDAQRKPPAREDAQPVGDKPLTKAQRSQLFHILRSGSVEVSGSWSVFDALATRGLIYISEYRIGFYRARATEKALAAYGSELGINTLATHPAPDALRVAVDALEVSRENIIGWFEAIDDETRVEHEMHISLKDDLAVIDQALAALQTEQVDAFLAAARAVQSWRDQ